MKKKNKKIGFVALDSAVVISRSLADLNFGQTVRIVGSNNYTDELIVVPDGESKRYLVHFTQCWPSYLGDRYEDREEQMHENGVYSR